MKFTEQIKSFFRNSKATKNVTVTDQELARWLGIHTEGRESLQEATYFACLKLLSETMGKIPYQLYQRTSEGVIRNYNDEVIRKLEVRPNPYMTPALFKSTIEVNRLHHGNGYVLQEINRRGRIENLWILPSENVKVLIDDAGILGRRNAIHYEYVDPQSGQLTAFPSDVILHFKNSHTLDGLIGMPVRDQLGALLDSGLESQRFMNSMFTNGLTAKATLQYTGDLNEESKRKLIEGLKRFANSRDNVGSIIPIPIGMELKPLNIKMTDAQFLELRKHTALQIASIFGVKPNHINDYQNSNYSNSEAQNLSFYTDALLYIVTQYEQEFTHKLLLDSQIDDGFYLELDCSVILRADTETQGKVLTGYVQNGIMTPNEARDKLKLPRIEHGNQAVMNGNYIPLSMVGTQYNTEHTPEE